jgi:hypothetical protein
MMTQCKLSTFDGIGHISSSAPPASHVKAPSPGAEHRCPGYQNLYPLIYLLADASPPGPPYHRGQLGSEGDGA